MNRPLAVLSRRKTTIIAALAILGIDVNLMLRVGNFQQVIGVQAVPNALRAAFPPKVIHNL